MLAQDALTETVNGGNAGTVKRQQGLAQTLICAVVDQPTFVGTGRRRLLRFRVVSAQIDQLAEQLAQSKHQLGSRLFRVGHDQDLVDRHRT